MFLGLHFNKNEINLRINSHRITRGAQLPISEEPLRSDTVIDKEFCAYLLVQYQLVHTVNVKFDLIRNSRVGNLWVLSDALQYRSLVLSGHCDGERG